LPELERLRDNPTEMRSTNIARIFDNDATLDALADIISASIKQEEAVLLPAVLGIDCRDGVKRLEKRLNRSVAVVATLPPSVPGIQVQTLLRRYFQELGGVYMLGDSAVGYKVDGDNISHLYTVNHADIPFVANNFVLATGSYFSGGLVADMNKVYEPLFGADVWQLSNRDEWYERDIFRGQAYESFGVETDAEFRAMRGGRVVGNLYVAGAALSGFNAVKEGCGAGVSILTALDVAERILSKK
jgi:glycerol-3-phosphate dehydrogenase subunit B